MTAPERARLRDRDDLSVYWDNHLRVAFEESAPHDLPAMVEASLAHVQMMKERGVLPERRADLLLRGLHTLIQRWGWGEGRGTGYHGPRHLDFTSQAEDPYYRLECELAKACAIPTSELDVQLARSRNDLDAGVFRMILRRDVLDITDLLLQTAQDTLAVASNGVKWLLTGHTHRRPAQPTTVGHVLSGLAESMLSQATELLSVYDELNVSPLGSAAFAGTDIEIDAARVADLLGFDSSFIASYEAVAGAEHFMRLAAIYARISATTARWARVLQEWMNFGWVKTPAEFSQGSSIMPQKQNPVVLEHMVSMSGASNGDLLSTMTTIAAGWYEDSNNATTDVQKHLWASGDRLVRLLRLHDGVMRGFEIGALPSAQQMVEAGITTTSVSEALATKGVPWRAAHDIVGGLFRSGSPLTWSLASVQQALLDAGADPELAELVMSAGLHPEAVLARVQAGSPGVDAVKAAVAQQQGRLAQLQSGGDVRRAHLAEARKALMELTRQSLPPAVHVFGDANLDVVVRGVCALPEPGTEVLVRGIASRLGGSAANSATHAARAGARTLLSAVVGEDATGHLLRDVLEQEGVLLDMDPTASAPTGVTVAVEDTGRDRAFLSSTGAAEAMTFERRELPDAGTYVLFAGYFLVPALREGTGLSFLEAARAAGCHTALDTGHPAQGWGAAEQRQLLEDVLPQVELFLPNESEACGLAGMEDPVDAARSIAARTGTTVVLKRGARGASVFAGGEQHDFPAPRVEVVDSTGAGDSLNGTLLAELAAGSSLAVATERAVAAASRHVSSTKS
ncbi:hypothetical protein DWB68_01015 [Galactobacter valiniphilus]|uniref:argininosuccinate lyase n=1 Tax=Galactobacter valiniphilus TaxID=2676122 RepID=A0A399JLV1_9MICC|nr:hypothetical protein DWB68_01015 [Galactobacter valiniphilus]